jgi:hypothetical protein
MIQLLRRAVERTSDALLKGQGAVTTNRMTGESKPGIRVSVRDYTKGLAPFSFTLCAPCQRGRLPWTLIRKSAKSRLQVRDSVNNSIPLYPDPKGYEILTEIPLTSSTVMSSRATPLIVVALLVLIGGA